MSLKEQRIVLITIIVLCAIFNERKMIANGETNCELFVIMIVLEQTLLALIRLLPNKFMLQDIFQKQFKILLYKINRRIISFSVYDTL